MARIPDVMDLGSSPVPRRARGIVQDRSGEIAADAAGQFAGAIGNIAQQFGEREDKFAYAQAKSSLLQADIATRRQLENDPDWRTYESRYQESMNKAIESSTKSIRGNRDRALFEMDAKLDLERGLGEIRNRAKSKEIDWGRSTIDQTLEANRAAALNAPDDASRQALLMASKEAIIGAKDKGYLSEVEATNAFQSWRDSYATGYLQMQPAAKRIEILAGKNTVADYLQPDVRAKLLEAAKNEDRDLSVRRESQAHEDAIVAKHGGDWSGALKSARSIDDPEVRDSTVSRIKIRQAEAKQVEMDRIETLSEEALSFINGGGQFADLPLNIKNGLKSSALNSLRSYAEQQAGGGVRRTDPETLIELSQLSTDDPQKFGETSMLQYRDKLSDGDFEEFVDLQRKIRTGTLDGKSSGFMSINQVRDERLRDLFGSAQPGAKEGPKTSAARRKFVVQFEDRLRASKQESGKPPTADEARKILDDMTTNVAISRDLWFDAKKPAYELTSEDIPQVPDADRNEIITELRKRGRPVTDQAIVDLYQLVNP